jgi:nitrite reductase/ring-hydroxylating ferredoxin subunit
MIKRIALVSIVLAAVVFAACSNEDTGGNGGTTGIVNPTWITAQQDGDTISIPVSDLDSGKMLHFQVAYQTADIAFMAYKLDGDYYVRANVCPPCRSIGFSLDGDNLVCDTCRSRFEARTGKGISGACVNYPKDDVAYEVSGASLAMEMDDLVTAYGNTLSPGLP